MEQMGRKPKKVKLNEDAFPTIHALALAPTVTEQSEPVKTASSTGTPKHQRPASLLMLSPTEEVACQSSPPKKKIRSGYSKREVARIMTEHTEKQSSTKDTFSHGDTNLPDLTTDLPDLANSLGIEQADEFEIHDVQKSTTSIGCWINMKKKQRSKYCQINVGSRSAKLE